MRQTGSFRFLTLTCFVFTLAPIFAQDPPKPAPVKAPIKTGKAPIIIIPGLTGSDLYNERTGEHVWFRPHRVDDDDIRLPISPNIARNRDNLVSRDVIRELKVVKFLPEIEVYERLIDAIQTRGGYKEGKWGAPAKDGDKDTFYVFPYDWRRDNIESARKLVRRIEEMKRKLGKPGLKFNVIAHSMGGLVARYAAMYGDSDIPGGKLEPSWPGARHFDKIFLLGTPNSGTVSALDALLNGFSYVGGGLNIPFIQDLSKFDVFTIPSAFQLLPYDGTLRAYDEFLQPMKIDIYDPATWEKYGWGVWKDDDYEKKYRPSEVIHIKSYLAAVLNRAKQFQTALNANNSKNVPVAIYLVGGDCKETLSGIVLRHDEKKERWYTMFKADTFTNSKGEKIAAERVKELLFSLGDSVVPKNSLVGDGLIGNGDGHVLPVTAEIFQCEGHTKLVTSTEVQDKLLLLLDPAVP